MTIMSFAVHGLRLLLLLLPLLVGAACINESAGHCTPPQLCKSSSSSLPGHPAAHNLPATALAFNASCTRGAARPLMLPAPLVLPRSDMVRRVQEEHGKLDILVNK